MFGHSLGMSCELSVARNYGNINRSSGCIIEKHCYKKVPSGLDPSMQRVEKVVADIHSGSESTSVKGSKNFINSVTPD